MKFRSILLTALLCMISPALFAQDAPPATPEAKPATPEAKPATPEAKPAATIDPKLKAVQDELVKKYNDIKSVSMKMSMKMSSPMGSQNGDGTMEMMRKEDKEMTRMEMDMVMAMGGQEMKGSITVISDGVLVLVIQDMGPMKQAIKQKADGQMSSMRTGGEEMFTNLHEENDIKLLEEETIDGEANYVLEATPKMPNPMAPAKMKYYFSKRSGVAVKMTGTDASGAETMNMTFTEIKVNGDIAADRFELKAPEGMQVQDMTGN